MIKKLDRIIVEEYDTGEQLSRLPNNEEVMNKINEIINFINYMSEQEGLNSRIDYLLNNLK